MPVRVNYRRKPNFNKRRYGSSTTTMVSSPMRSAMRSVPRAISTRGTPDGYYEIPVNIFRKIYWNMSTGLWDTNQTTGASIGATGFNGFSFASQLDTAICTTGTATQSIAIPGISEMTAVFDQCKLVKIEYEFWFANQAHQLGSTALDSPEMFIVTDYDNTDVPTSLGEIMQYSKVHRVVGNANNGKYKITLYPKVRYPVGSAGDEAGTGSSLTGIEGARYQDLQKPAAMHMGLRGWFNTNSSNATASLGYLHVLEKQTRRYKITK